MKIAMMMAMDRNKLVGRDGDLPWKISSDLQYFKRVTMSKPMIMGRVTFESLGGVLPGRPHIVITRDKNWQHEGVDVVHSLAEAVQQAQGYTADEMMIIGGASVCADAMSQVQRLYLTVIDHEFEGDRWLESFDWKDWQIDSEELHDESDEGGYRFTYYVLSPAAD
jgi:dihydrofolate reductase